jgi:hypothetical protein
MKHLLLPICLLFTSTFALFGSETENLELRKKITKSFDCPSSKSVEISNTYGKIAVVVYNGSQVKFDIDIIAKADSKAKAQKELDRVSVLFNDNTSKVSAKTSIEDKSSWFNWSWSWNGNSEIQINYTLYVPDNRSLTLSQTYGNVYLPNYGGQTNLDVAYGNIEGADLSNTTNIELSYGEGKLGCIKNGKFDIAYSDFSINSSAAITTELQYGKLNIIETCESLNIDTDYSEINIGNVNKINGSGGYNHYQLASAGDVKMDNEYGDVNIRNLRGNVNINSDYHTTKIENVTTSVREINVYGDYGTLKIMAADGYTYNVTGSYNTVKGPNSNSDGDDDDKIVKGTKKGSKSNAIIKVVGDYMHVSLK